MTYFVTPVRPEYHAPIMHHYLEQAERFANAQRSFGTVLALTCATATALSTSLQYLGKGVLDRAYCYYDVAKTEGNLRWIDTGLRIRQNFFLAARCLSLAFAPRTAASALKELRSRELTLEDAVLGQSLSGESFQLWVVSMNSLIATTSSKYAAAHGVEMIAQSSVGDEVLDVGPELERVRRAIARHAANWERLKDLITPENAEDVVNWMEETAGFTFGDETIEESLFAFMKRKDEVAPEVKAAHSWSLPSNDSELTQVCLDYARRFAGSCQGGVAYFLTLASAASFFNGFAYGAKGLGDLTIAWLKGEDRGAALRENGAQVRKSLYLAVHYCFFAVRATFGSTQVREDLKSLPMKKPLVARLSYTQGVREPLSGADYARVMRTAQSCDRGGFEAWLANFYWLDQTRRYFHSRENQGEAAVRERGVDAADRSRRTDDARGLGLARNEEAQWIERWELLEKEMAGTKLVSLDHAGKVRALKQRKESLFRAISFSEK